VPTRAEELAANLRAVRARIEKACASAGRAPESVTLVAVTKTFPAADVRLLADLGVSDVGENRDQEAAAKHAACAELALRWHFVGRLQRNKVRSVATYADVVHSVDRAELVSALGAAATAAHRDLVALIQVSLDGDPARGGVPPPGVPDLAAAVAATPGLRLGGVMAVAPLAVEADASFAALAEIAAALRSDHPSATIVSAGMTADLEPAIRHGATHVRVGTALLGRRGAAVG
jgi:pyridoxal phosphate enzyme (YggS family)